MCVQTVARILSLMSIVEFGVACVVYRLAFTVNCQLCSERKVEGRADVQTIAVARAQSLLHADNGPVDGRESIKVRFVHAPDLVDEEVIA